MMGTLLCLKSKMDTKSDIKKIVKQKHLFGVMNETKWKAVYSEFQGAGLPFLFRSKTIDGEIFPEDHLRFDVREVTPQHLLSIMWLEVHSKEEKYMGDLLPLKLFDHTESAIELTRKAKARFTLADYGIKIWGDTRPGEYIEFYKKT